MARDSAVDSRPVTVEVHGAIGQVPGPVATPLAVAVAELLQNAVEHAFVDRDGGTAADADSSLAAREPRIDLVLEDHGDRLAVEVRDNGAGLPGDFDLDGTRSLGLAIVRALVRNQLSGSIEMASDDGTTVHLSIPMAERAQT
jgi:two-component sensor histidine kinase